MKKTSKFTTKEINDIYNKYLSFLSEHSPDIFMNDAEVPDDYDDQAFINIDFPQTINNNGTILILKKDENIFFKFYYDTVNFTPNKQSGECLDFMKPYSINDNLLIIFQQYKRWVKTYES